MIDYEFGDWGVGFVLKYQGSVFPKSCVWALPAGCFSCVYRLILDYVIGEPPDVGGSAFTALWGGYTFILGFLLVFRTQIAYGRFWEGVGILQAVKGGWVNAVSNLIAFTSTDPNMRDDVEAFTHQLVRLMSMLFCASLQEVADMEDECFQILGDEGIGEESLEFLSSTPEKSEVILMWIQRLIVFNHERKVVPIAPPILSRVFQELSNGIIDVQAAKKISDFPFPFPYAQIISCFLLMHWFLSPFFGALLINNVPLAGIVTFATVFAVWSINYIAAEIEMPFGDDANDLPIADMQENFNRSLRIIMDPMAQHPPSFAFDPAIHGALAPQKSRISTFVHLEALGDGEAAKLVRSPSVLSGGSNPDGPGELEEAEQAESSYVVRGRPTTSGTARFSVERSSQSQEKQASAAAGMAERPAAGAANGLAIPVEGSVANFPLPPETTGTSCASSPPETRSHYVMPKTPNVEADSRSPRPTAVPLLPNAASLTRSRVNMSGSEVIPALPETFGRSLQDARIQESHLHNGVNHSEVKLHDAPNDLENGKVDLVGLNDLAGHPPATKL
eukprot:TRINITY_DN8158_c0_g1_i1.p1 TRINITY_DN8158_c0_g1~~TRINITY_DN8158_c0_g1_i1.p1  ORF type:complete len:561 (+),score=79.44 TRINITY_DN8158_c0_g1_i1:106-1788(+)